MREELYIEYMPKKAFDYEYVKRICEYYIKFEKMANDIVIAEYLENLIRKIIEDRRKQLYDATSELNEMVINYMFEVDLPDIYEKVEKNQNDTECSILIQGWEKLKNIIAKESYWEKAVYQYLTGLAEAHPIISKTIIAILSGILIGLLTDCVVDGIGLDKIKNEETSGITLESLLKMSNGENILIETKNGEYRIIYFGEQASDSKKENP